MTFTNGSQKSLVIGLIRDKTIVLYHVILSTRHLSPKRKLFIYHRHVSDTQDGYVLICDNGPMFDNDVNCYFACPNEGPAPPESIHVAFGTRFICNEIKNQ